MFLSEAKIAAQISHANVCSVYELGEIDGRYFIAMEYLEGVPFACFRRPDMYGGSIDPRLVAGLGIQACQGLHHAHNLKKPDGTLLEVVHRDVSANNLFITVDGNVKVLDFGIAKVQDASVRTSTGSVKGTYAYMAPEQLRGEKLDRRTDLFALGTVLWELFARRHCLSRRIRFPMSPNSVPTFRPRSPRPSRRRCRARAMIGSPPRARCPRRSRSPSRHSADR
jgi:serine/threonine-protein kinase